MNAKPHHARAAEPQPEPSTALDALAYVREIAAYAPGKPIEELAREFGLDPRNIVKLASNENPLGAPARAREAMLATMEEVGRYPDGNAFALRSALAQRLDVPMEWVTVGSGSNDILEMAAGAMLAPGRSCIFSQYSFAVYAIATQARGARAIVVPAKHYGHDLDGMRRALSTDTRLIYIANPNNPTGTFVDGATLEAFLQAVPPETVVVIDEAYNEYLPPQARYDAIAWVRRHPNLLVSRTFSKAYGLAGLRVGYGVAQGELSGLLNRVRMPFNVSVPAQAAACAALSDEDFLRRSYELNHRGLRELEIALKRMGLETVPSFANFILVRIGPAARVYQELLARGVIVRPVANYDLPEWLRVTIGLPQENERFINALSAALQSVRAQHS
ncbi:MAG TPA: histidinol-phosphate transaminase [Burkholderiaceae bacterium]|nr:histidinol-phosphate transaminase [Burkholderiaceae bacterium]